MVEISRLAATLADRILMRREAGIEIPPELFRMLVHSAQALHDRQMPWPESVKFVLLEVARQSFSTQPEKEFTVLDLPSIGHTSEG
jgi:hypothetical protein